MSVVTVLEQKWVGRFARNLATVMDDNDVTPAELAFRSGVSRVTIHRYLNAERSPKAYHVRLLADGLGVPYEFLMD